MVHAETHRCSLNLELKLKWGAALKATDGILPRIYYETLAHCGVALFQMGEDGAAHYNKARRRRRTVQYDTASCKKLPLFEFDADEAVTQAQAWKLFVDHAPFQEHTSGVKITKPGQGGEGREARGEGQGSGQATRVRL